MAQETSKGSEVAEGDKTSLEPEQVLMSTEDRSPKLRPGGRLQGQGQGRGVLP